MKIKISLILSKAGVNFLPVDVPNSDASHLPHQHTPPSGLSTNGDKPQLTNKQKLSEGSGGKEDQFKSPLVRDQTVALQSFEIGFFNVASVPLPNHKIRNVMMMVSSGQVIQL